MASKFSSHFFISFNQFFSSSSFLFFFVTHLLLSNNAHREKKTHCIDDLILYSWRQKKNDCVYTMCYTSLLLGGKMVHGLWKLNLNQSPGESQVQKPHKWEKHSYIPTFSTFCDHCGTVLHGLYQQGLKCSGTEWKTIPLCYEWRE